MKTEKACEHQSSVVLQCNETEKVSIHDVFYGRNSGDTSCHNSGSTTCFHPNATEIVKNICKDNSTCSVSPKGSFWHFDATCDALNAQLIVHYICVSRGMVYCFFHQGHHLGGGGLRIAHLFHTLNL